MFSSIVAPCVNCLFAAKLGPPLSDLFPLSVPGDSIIPYQQTLVYRIKRNENNMHNTVGHSTTLVTFR